MLQWEHDVKVSAWCTYMGAYLAISRCWTFCIILSLSTSKSLRISIWIVERQTELSNHHMNSQNWGDRGFPTWGEWWDHYVLWGECRNSSRNGQSQKGCRSMWARCREVLKWLGAIATWNKYSRGRWYIWVAVSDRKAEIHAKRQHHARSLVITPNPSGRSTDLLGSMTRKGLGRQELTLQAHSYIVYSKRNNSTELGWWRWMK